MTRIVTLYNHKGGVSKTTTTFNVAHYLARAGHKTLVVDADPQCNMTELLMFKTIEEYDEKGIETLPGKSLLDLLQPRIFGETPSVEISANDLVQISEKLFVLRGDVNLSTIEDSMAEAHSQRFSTKIHEKRTYVALADALRRIAKTEGFEAVLIDVGPSSGALSFLVKERDGLSFVDYLDAQQKEQIAVSQKLIDRGVQNPALAEKLIWLGEYVNFRFGEGSIKLAARFS